MKSYCSKCGSKKRYCTSCGTEEPCSCTGVFSVHMCAEPLTYLNEQKYCTLCGRSMPSVKYCRSCGSRIYKRHSCSGFDSEETHFCLGY